MKKYFVVFSLLVISISSFAQADSDSAIKQSLRKLGLQQTEIQSSPLPGIKTILTESGVLYMTEDGKHLIQGPLYDISGDKPVSATNAVLKTKTEALKDQMIIYKAPQEKHVITIFTDISCGYCRKLHENMEKYNQAGITVRYLAFPREGVNGKVEKSMKSIWCAANPRKALDAAMKDDAISPISCDIDLAKHHQLGILYGIQGTPAILLENGMMIPGFQGPEELKQLLDSQTKGQ